MIQLTIKPQRKRTNDSSVFKCATNFQLIMHRYDTHSLETTVVNPSTNIVKQSGESHEHTNVNNGL